MKSIPLLAPLLTLTALLAACNSATPTTPGTGNGGTTGSVGVTAINGRVTSSTGSANTVELLADGTLDKSGSNPLLASAALSGGSFSLTLPTPAGSLLVTPSFTPDSSCSGTLTSSNSGARTYTLALLDLTASGSYLQTIDTEQTTQSSSGGTTTVSGSQQLWVYASAASTLSGRVVCTSGSATVNLTANAPLTAGWNVLSQSFSGQGTSSGVTVNLTLQTGSDGVSSWSTSSQVGPASLAPAGLRDGLRLARNLLRL